MKPIGKVIAPAAVQLERLLPGPIERVWSYLTESELRKTWLAAGTMDLQAGSAFEFTFHHDNISPEETPEKYRKYDGEKLRGKIVRCEPPRLLVFTWDEGAEESEVTFELAPAVDKVRMVLTHRKLPDLKEMSSVSSGWQIHTGILEDRLKGTTPGPFWTGYETTEAEYAKLYADLPDNLNPRPAQS